jgi:hypothetical protein
VTALNVGYVASHKLVCGKIEATIEAMKIIGACVAINLTLLPDKNSKKVKIELRIQNQ